MHALPTTRLHCNSRLAVHGVAKDDPYPAAVNVWSAKHRMRACMHAHPSMPSCTSTYVHAYTGVGSFLPCDPLGSTCSVCTTAWMGPSQTACDRGVHAHAIRIWSCTRAHGRVPGRTRTHAERPQHVHQGRTTPCAQDQGARPSLLPLPTPPSRRTRLEHAGRMAGVIPKTVRAHCDEIGRAHV